MTEQEQNHNYGFYCNVCLAYVEPECICNRIMGYDPETGYPIANLTEDDEACLYNGSVSQAADELKLDTIMKTEDTGPTANTENIICNEVRPLTLASDIINEEGIVDNKKRFYCIECSKFIEDEYVSCDSNDRPVVHHNNGRHYVIFGTDIQLLLEHGTSQLGQIATYELAQMYGVSVQQLDEVLANVGGDL